MVQIRQKQRPIASSIFPALKCPIALLTLFSSFPLSPFSLSHLCRFLFTLSCVLSSVVIAALSPLSGALIWTFYVSSVCYFLIIFFPGSLIYALKSCVSHIYLQWPLLSFKFTSLTRLTSLESRFLKKLLFCSTKLWTSPLTAFVKSIA